MATITLKLKKELPSVPLEAEISPDNFKGRKIDEIKAFPMMKGNKEVKLGDYFEVKGESAENPEDIKIIIEGNVDRVKYIGSKMTAGEIVIKGNVGMHTGDDMKGGKILVEGDCADFCALEMKGGEFEVKGSAGNYLLAAKRGTWRGSSKGKVIVHGNCGVEAGAWLRGKTILLNIKGNAGAFLGVHMHLGTIIVDGDVAPRAGGEMSGGKIIINGKLTEMLPSFVYAAEVKEIVLSEEMKIQGDYLKFEGDFANISPKAKKKGEIYLNRAKNQELIPK
ncbi:MAG: formylmethanofuran dehydrogenase subunit C [Candidatus Helarchaeota archaeon]